MILRRIFCVTLSVLFGSVFLYCSVFATSHASVVISEIGAFEATGYEWIEIFNAGDTPVDLSGWTFWEAGVNHGLTLVAGENSMLAPGAYALIVQNDSLFFSLYDVGAALVFDSSWGTLNEGGELVGLKDATGMLQEEFVYIPAPDFSLERIVEHALDYSFQNWREHPSSHTAGAPNYWASVDGGSPNSDSPIPVPVITANTTTVFSVESILFSALDSAVGEYDRTYHWNFGDGTVGEGITISHEYSIPGVYTVTLVIENSYGNTGVASIDVVISSHELETPAPSSTPQHVTAQLFISEVYPVAASNTNEWVELYNVGETEVDLSLLFFVDTGGNVVTLEGMIPPHSFFVVDFSRAILNNSGDTLFLMEHSVDQAIDAVSYGAVEGSTISSPSSEQSISRQFIVSGEKKVGGSFFITDTITKQTENIFNSVFGVDTATPETSTPTSTTSVPPIVEPADDTPYEGVLVINELVSDPADGATEFVELFHRGAVSIQLDGWWIEDGSEAKTFLQGTILPQGFFVVDQPKGSLNNTGDTLTLFAPNGRSIDSVTYGKWDDGNINDNAPLAKDPQSLGRKADGRDSDYDRHDFVLTDFVTKGSANRISFPLDTTDQTHGATDLATGNIIITEVFPNPEGDDSEHEFIELYNASDVDISLADWKIGDTTEKRYSFSQTVLSKKQYAAFFRSETGIALNNSGEEEVRLFSPTNILVDSVTYRGSVPEDNSYSRRDDGMFFWTSSVTPNQKNDIVRAAVFPVVVVDDIGDDIVTGDTVVFDASDTYDPDGSITDIFWDFGNGQIVQGSVAQFSFSFPGEYQIIVHATDNEGNKTMQEVYCDVFAANGAGGYFSLLPVEDLVVSEVFPNPDGVDDGEFIELYNPSDEPVDISLLRIDDAEGGSRPFKIPAGTVVPAHGYLVLFREETGIALNNTFDSVRLLYPDDTLAFEFLYDDVVEGASYAFDEHVWCWTTEVTPGEANRCVDPPLGVGSKKNLARGTIAALPISLDRLRDSDSGDTVIVRGIVSVLPGILSSQYFYISDNNLPGVQVYMYKKLFPDLLLGDLVEVTGEISEIQGETRIKVLHEYDIAVVGRGHELVPTLIDIQDIGELHEGALIHIQGEVTEVKTSYLYVDDGTEEIKVYFKKSVGIPKGIVSLGDMVDIVGIVGQTKTEYQLLPRSKEDIAQTAAALSASSAYQESFVGGKASSDASIAETYLTVTAGGLTSILMGLVMRARGAVLLGFLQKAARVAIKNIRFRG